MEEQEVFGERLLRARAVLGTSDPLQLLRERETPKERWAWPDQDLPEADR